jgi:Zn-dependent protease
VKILVLLLATLKWGKLLTTGGTMLVSIAVYAWLWGWPFAAGFVGLLFVHELGHYVAARQRGLDIGGLFFVPFVGAAVTLRGGFSNVRTQAYVAIAGPLAGTVAAVACYLLGRYTDTPLLIALAYAGLFLNLFNLLPLPMLDGGQITAILSPRVWLVGAPLLVAVMLYRPSPILILVAVISLPQLVKAWNYDPKAPENAAYYDVPLQAKLEYGGLYLALTAYLAVMTYELHETLQTIHPVS